MNSVKRIEALKKRYIESITGRSHKRLEGIDCDENTSEVAEVALKAHTPEAIGLRERTYV